MTYDNISSLDKLLRASHEPISEYEAIQIINSMVYSDKNIAWKRIEPEYIQILANEFINNINTIKGELAVRRDNEGNGIIITKGKVPIIYKRPFLKDQFDNEAMVSLLHAIPQINLKRLYDDKVITKKYIIGRNGLYENSDSYSNFIDLVGQLENPYATRIGLRYYYYPKADSNTRIYVDRNLGHRVAEEKLDEDHIISQDFIFDPDGLSIRSLQSRSNPQLGEKIYNEVYSLTPLNPPVIVNGSMAKPKVYQKY